MAKTKEEIFQSYKQKILAQARNNSNSEKFFKGIIPPKTSWTRFCVIQHICSFPDIDPIRMAAEVAQNGIQVYFDNTAITEEKNVKLEIKVNKYRKRPANENASSSYE